MNAPPEINGYTIQRLIASGGTADVYLARQESLGRDVALKVLSNQQRDANFTDRFLKEGRLIASLQHPNIITIYDVGVDRGQHYLAMELVEGGDLDRQIQGKPFTPVRALTVLRDVASCLQFVHERGIIHRDVKPGNVLFRKNGSLVLTDFGIAKLMADDVKLTQTGAAVGSPAYSSPEQSQGLALDRRTDIYSLGVMFLEMLLGYNPYRAETFANTSINHIQMPVPRLDGPLRVYQTLIDKMLAKQPADRFPSMEAILEYLANPPRQGWLGQWKLPMAWLPRSPVAWVAVLSTALLLGAIGYTGWRHYSIQQEVHRWLVLAEDAKQADRLLTPAGDSALDYYRRVLELDPSNDQAKQGIEDLAGHYLSLALRAQERQRPKEALIYVARGLSVDPYNLTLVNLKAELEQDVLEQRAAQRQGRTPTRTDEKKPTRNFFQRLFD